MIGLLWAALARAEEPSPRVREEIQPDGSVKLVPARQTPADAREAKELLLEFDDISLHDLATYFADVMRKNFLLPSDGALSSKRVQFVGHATMTIDEAWEAFRSALMYHGFTTLESGEVITIVSTGDAKRRPLDVGEGAPRAGDVFVTRTLAVENARAADLIPILSPLLSEGAEVVAYAPGNTIIITDSASNVRKVADLVEALDVAAPETTLRSIALTHAPASEIKSIIEALYVSPSQEASKTARPQQGAGPKAQKVKASGPSISSTGETGQIVSKVLDYERTNALVVLANPEGHAAVAALIAELDVDVSARKHLHVVHPKYALAEEIAAVLEKLREESKDSRGGKEGKALPAGAATSDAAWTDGTARFAADPSTNALAVVAEPEEYSAISELIAELDVARGQVYVDAVFVELTNTDGRELALGAHVLPGENSPGLLSAQLDPDQQLSSFAVTPDLLSGLATGVFGPAISSTLPDGTPISVPVFGIALRALQATTELQVMGNPSLLALDHEEATLSVGRKIPYQTSTTPTIAGLPVQTFDRLDVAMELAVTPHIHDPGLVTLDLKLTVDEVEGSSAESALEGGPVTTNREVATQAMVEHGQTIVLAGVAGTKFEVVESKVPILGDIPLIGALFRGSSKETRRTHLMVFLTPYVVQRPADLLEIRRVKEAQRLEYIRRFQGKRSEEWLRELDGLVSGAP